MVAWPRGEKLTGEALEPCIKVQKRNYFSYQDHPTEENPVQEELVFPLWYPSLRCAHGESTDFFLPV